jgi:hypothetical protein
MRKLRESTQAHMAAELESVRTARDAALATIAAHAKAPQVRIGETDMVGLPHPETPQTPVLSLLKRKRSDENDEGDNELKRGVDVGVGASDAADVTMTDAVNPTTLTTTTTNTNGIDVPSPKRARRITTIVLHTATAVTVGAVATWSALAFS